MTRVVRNSGLLLKSNQIEPQSERSAAKCEISYSNNRENEPTADLERNRITW